MPAFGAEHFTTETIADQNPVTTQRQMQLYCQAQQLVEKVLDGEEKQLDVNKTVLAAFSGNQLVGVINYGKDDDLNGWGYISILAVDTSFQKKGVGQFLLNKAKATLKQQGVSYLYLDSTEDAVLFMKRKVFLILVAQVRLLH